MELKDKVAVVTGAASGVGLAMAERFGKEGMRLVLADIDDEGLHRVGQALDQQGVAVQTLRTDVSKGRQVGALADTAYERFGAVDVLCNNAGVAVVGPVWDRPVADWAWALGVNVWGVIHGLRAFVPRMLEQDTPGHIVNTASIAGLLCPPLSGPYVASKHAVVGITECLHHDLALRGAKINASVLCPGFVRTRITESERARPDEYRSPASGDDPFARDVEEFYSKQVEEGIDPVEVAERVVEAIQEPRFYIFTHDHEKALRARFDAIVAAENPKTRPLAQG